MAQTVEWDVVDQVYRYGKAVINNNVITGSANAVATEVKARIVRVSEQLQRGEISVDEWYYSMQVNTKMLAGAETALARGGWDQMRPKDWDRASEVALEQWEGRSAKTIRTSTGKVVERKGFPGLRKMAEDVTAGRYGQGELSGGFLSRAGNYADAGYSHYVNARIEAHTEVGYAFAARLLGDLDHCSDCVEWAALGRIPIEEMESDYPMGSSVCGVHCGCAITFYRTMDS